uniref:Uncharacterized protein n=1 Tax=viral metagenome TaxID=1070528 RepID=A0A6M3ID43_9ZZZZ
MFNGKGVSETDRILIALTSLALNAPSTYTIAWSKDDPEKQKHFPILYAGIGTSIATVVGAIFGHKDWGNLLMWGGMLGTFALFMYVVFIYKNADGEDQFLFVNGETSDAEPVHILMV